MSDLIDTASGLFYRFAASGALPASWFRDVNPAGVVRTKRTGRLSLEIVTHCWQYSHFLIYQLSSLVNHRTDKLDVTMTVYHAPGDESVLRVLRFFGDIDVPGVSWSWRPVAQGAAFSPQYRPQSCRPGYPGRLDLVHRRRHRVLQELPQYAGGHVAGKGRHIGASENDTGHVVATGGP